MTLEKTSRKSVLVRCLRLFGDVRPQEGGRLLLLAANLLLLLFAYYLLKTIREPLVLGEHGGGAEVKSYAAALQAVILVGISLGFGWLATRMGRMKLLASVTLFFASNLVLFAGLFIWLPKIRLGLGIAFFIWVGCFSVMIIAQFWAFANDLYTKDQGKRLFAIVAGGSAVGAVLGAKLAKPLYKAIGPFAIMLIAAGILVVCLGLTWLVHRSDDPTAAAAGARDRPLLPGSGVSLMLKDRYLLLVGLLSLVKNWVNTTGEYILDRRLLEVAKLKAGTGVAGLESYIASFKSDYFTYVNFTVMILQFFAVSRIIRYLGVRKSLFVLPIIALTAYSTMAIVPILSVILIGKIAENSTDYSLEKTAEQMLFLVTSREAKYKVKAIVDTFLVRMGDVLTAGLVWVGSRLALSTLGFIIANMVLVVGWLAVVVALARTKDVKERAAVKAKAPHARRGAAAVAAG